MGFAGVSESRNTRGRVVMLVDNGVRGDSRVQKAARSAADAGWDVVLLGRAPYGQPESWRLGRAEVRLIAMPDPLARRRHEFRRVWRRGPLAYPPSGIAAHRAQWVKAWKADLQVRAAALSLAAGQGEPVGRSRIKQRLLRCESVAATVLGRWVSFRYWQLTRGQRARRKLTGLRDRLYTRFWQAVQGDRAWRRLEPGLWDFELAFGPVIDKLAPDLIHSHDFRMLGVGARAAIRARAAGRPVKLVWDAHEFVPGLNPGVNNARWLPAHCAYEREYVPYADAAITVSVALADLLHREHKLAERPAVVLNAPSAKTGAASGAGEDEPDEVPDVRTQCGLAPDVPLLAYCGAIAPVRGVRIMVEALPALAEVHIALVSLPPGRQSTRYVDELRSRAVELGVADRVHVLRYAPHDQVSRVLATADAAVSPLHHLPNHEIALSNKFFEYSHARLPVVVSDVRTMAETVRATGQGEVFRAEDLDDYIRAVRAVLAEPQRYRAAYDRPGMLDAWTWEAQAEIIEAVYRRLLPDRPPVTEPRQPSASDELAVAPARV